MTMSEKLAALSDPEVSVHYSSLPDVEILRLWDTTRLKDTQRYFLYREILGRGLESHLLSSRKNRRKFLFDNEYLIIKYREGTWGDGGFATRKSTDLYVYFTVLPLLIVLILNKLGRYVLGDDNVWLIIISGVLGCFSLMLWILLPTGLLTKSYLFVTNQRIGYYRKILQIFKLPIKWLDLNEGHLICGTLYYWPTLSGAFLGCGTKEKALKYVYLGLRLDRYDHLHQRINLKLSMLASIYLFELIKLISSKTKAVLYVAPIIYPKHNDGGDLLMDYRFKGSHLEDLQHFFKTIDRRSLLQAKNVVYMGKTNMEHLSDFFESIEEATLPDNQLDALNPSNAEIILAYLPGSRSGYWKSPLIVLTTDSRSGYWKSPLIALTTDGVKYYKRGGGRLKFGYSWSDPNLTVGISDGSVNIMYKKKKVIQMNWSIIDVPIFDIFQILGLKQIYSSMHNSYWGH